MPILSLGIGTLFLKLGFILSSLGFPLLGTGFSLAPPPAAEPSFVGPSPNPLAVPWAASIHWVRFIARCCKFHWARFPSVFPLFSHSRNFRTHLISDLTDLIPGAAISPRACPEPSGLRCDFGVASHASGS